MLRLENAVLEQGDFRMEARFDLPRGAFGALIGPSGGGKSTILSAIAGFIAPTRGRILIDSADQAPLAPADRPVTMLFQEHNLFPHLDVGQNVGLGVSPRLRLTADDRARIEAALAEVGLAGLAARRPAELSGGQRQRAALARALIRDRPVLLLDEPFAALGPAQRREMLELVDRIRRDRGLTVLMVTHAPDEARRAGLVGVVAENRLDGLAPADEVFANPPPALAVYLG